MPALVPIRYGRMLNLPFAFYRGAARIMACDLATTADSGLQAQLCGDAHLSNFGMFASADWRLVFGANDLTNAPRPMGVGRETVRGKCGGGRARERPHPQGAHGGDTSDGGELPPAMREFATMTNLAVWYSRQEVDSIMDSLRSQLDAKRVKLLENVGQTRTKDSLHAFSRLTETVNGQPRIISDPPLIQPAPDILAGDPGEATWAQLRQIIRDYREFAAE